MPSSTLIEDLQQDGDLRTLAYSPDGQHLAIADGDGVLTLRDAATHEVVGRRHLDIGALGPLAWLPDSSRLVVGGDRLIAVCRRDELFGESVAKPRPRGEPLTVKASTSLVENLSYSPDGRKLLGWAPKGRMFLWDLSRGAGGAKLAARFRPTDGLPIAVSWSPDGERLALLLRGWESCFCDAHSGARDSSPLSLAARNALFTAFTPQGRLLVNRDATPNTGRSTLVELWEVDGRRLFAREVPLESSPQAVTHAVAGAADRHLYFAVEHNGIYRWSPAENEVVCLFTQSAQVGALAVRDDERQALTIGGKNALVWSLPEGKCQLKLQHPLTCSGAAFLPGGRVITACYDGLVRLWDDTGREMLTLDLAMGKIFSFAVSPDQMTFSAGVEKKDAGTSRVVLMDVPE
jgi:WD40 repeat protein